MARWSWYEIHFHERVRSRRELTRMRRILLSLDGDAPAALDGYTGRDSFTGRSVESKAGILSVEPAIVQSHYLDETGLASVWRSPLVPCGAVMALFHRLGYPSYGLAVGGGYVDDWDGFEDRVADKQRVGAWRGSEGELWRLEYLDDSAVRSIQRVTRALDPYLPGRHHDWPAYASPSWCKRSKTLWRHDQ